MSDQISVSPLYPQIKIGNGEAERWAHLYGSAAAAAIVSTARTASRPVMVITEDMPAAYRLEQELTFYKGDSDLPILMFPDWETLPYDSFSPHQDIISQRLATLCQLPGINSGVLIIPVSTLMHYLPPRTYIEAHSLSINVGDNILLEDMRQRLISYGYQYVSQVTEYGEFAIRGSILDLYPMGSTLPYRIDLFDEEVESIRTFDPDNQRSIKQITSIRLLPARETPLDEAGINHFRTAFEQQFPEAPLDGLIYREVSKGIAPAGIEYYLPLFFDKTSLLTDYLPQETIVFQMDGVTGNSENFWEEVCERYEQGRYDIDHPLLPPEICFSQTSQLKERVSDFYCINLQSFELQASEPGTNFNSKSPPKLYFNTRSQQPAAALLTFINDFSGRILFVAESTGRREILLETLKGCDVFPSVTPSWSDFIDSDTPIGITVAPLEHGLLLEEPAIAIITEPQLFGDHVKQSRRRSKAGRDTDAIIRNLSELEVGAPVVHDDYGVGRYLGLQMLTVGGLESEYLMLEYAGNDKLYVPVSSLHLINRYTGAAPETAPLHKLGSGQWERAKRKATERIHDVAAELLDVYARRAAKQGHVYPPADEQYNAFAAGFPFEETPDQEDAIHAVIDDMVGSKPMDRVICGDVGFGKTEVALRATFMAIQGSKQVAVLVPTTLLAQQHYQTFTDRFADWPVKIESLSRFRSAKQQKETLARLADGKVDIVIGTHRLLQKDVKFKDLGLAIIDEEHRFGVRHKERLKSLRAEVDMLTLTATPIPRTLNMAMSGIRDLSVIATPPLRRLAIKTFVSEWKDAMLREACTREIKRGGQVYFLHNEVKTIEKKAQELKELIPEATIRIAHGQMHEHELEQVMLDFYHRRFNMLVCSTIIESGIDVPTANTIIMNRADKLGLAQLYQLRGRVGRSHHRAYAYLITPQKKVMTADARKRLEAIESLEDLGAGFTLATHDLEIRGAGELLGDEQSGHMHEIGFSMYTELLERAVTALKEGREPMLDRPLDHGAEIDLHVPALMPEGYIPDVHTRLIMYKRIANADTHEALKDLQVEMIDRFGLLPDQTKNLFRITTIKLMATPLGIKKIDAGTNSARLVFNEQPNIEPATIINLIQSQPSKYKLDGMEKLKITADMEDLDTRFTAIEDLLATLSEKQAA